MRPKKQQKRSDSSVDIALPDEQIRRHIEKITSAAEADDYATLATSIRAASADGMSLAVGIPVSGIELPLPCYLTRTRRLSLLRQLLDDGVLSFSECGVLHEDMWEHCIRQRKADIPIVCAVMEHFGADLQGPEAGSIALWLQSNPSLVRPLTVELSIAPSPYPHLARAVVQVTPTNSQAVTIAAKQDMIDWLEPEIDHLATERPEGYRSWRLLYNHLQSQGGLSTPMQVALATLAALSEHGSEDASAVEKAKREAMLDIHLRSSAPSTSDVARVCSELEQYDCTGIERLSDMIASWASRLPAETLVTELCKNPYPNAASAIVSSCPSIYELITVAVHYDLDDTYQCYMDRNCTRVVEYLRTRDAAEARSVIQRCFPRVELFHLAVHHRLTDVMFDDDYYDVETWIDGIINDLCARDAVSARAILDICDSFYMLVSVAVHHGFTDMIPAMVDRTPDDMVDYLRTREAAEARTVVELCPSRCELIYVAAHHGFSDLIAGYLRRDLAGVERFLSKDVFGLSKFLPKCSAEHWQLVPFVVQYRCKLVSHFITRDADGRIIAPGSSPTSPHRLSDDDAVNAWLWLIKGDGHVTDKAWDAMKATGLLNGEPAIVQMLDGLYASGRKIVSAIRFRSVHYDDCRVIFRHAISTSNLDMVKYFMDREMPRCRLERHWLNHVRDVPMTL
jgi:hypothetical protein